MFNQQTPLEILLGLCLPFREDQKASYGCTAIDNTQISRFYSWLLILSGKAEKLGVWGNTRGWSEARRAERRVVCEWVRGEFERGAAGRER